MGGSLGGALGGIFPRGGKALAPKLGPLPSPARGVLELQRAEPSIAAHSWAGESLGCSIILGLQASGLPPLPPQPQNFALWLQPTADVYPRTLPGNGTFVILLPQGRGGQGHPFNS